MFIVKIQVPDAHVVRVWQLALRAVRQWLLSQADEDEYNASLEVGETNGEAKRDELVYYLAVQPRNA